MMFQMCRTVGWIFGIFYSSRLLILSKFLPLPLTQTSNYTYTKHVHSYRWYILKCNRSSVLLFIAHKKNLWNWWTCLSEATYHRLCLCGSDFVKCEHGSWLCLGVNVPSRNQLEQGNKKEWRERVKIIWFTILVSVTFLFSCDLYTNILWKHWKKMKILLRC